MSKKIFNSVEWSKETQNNTGLPRPYYKGKAKKIKIANVAKKVPIPWQSKPETIRGNFLKLDINKEKLVVINELCGYCGIKFEEKDPVVRWKTALLTQVKKFDEEGPIVYSDIYPLHTECMRQARMFCPHMKQKSDKDIEQGLFLELKKNAEIQIKIIEKIHKVFKPIA